MKNTQLPPPTPQALARSKYLTHFIQKNIEAHGGQISFAEYMAAALYAPELGYYDSENRIFGPSGDFMTAPEYSALFAKCISETWKIYIEKTGHDTFIEIGAGSGIFTYDFLSVLQNTEYFPKKYIIIEASDILRQRQKKFLEKNLPEVITHIQWLDQLPDQTTGLLFANELLDALPVHCFEWKNKTLLERSVTFRNELSWAHRPPSQALQQLFADILQIGPLPDFYQSEIRLVLPNWVKHITAKIKSGAFLFIDYGYGRREYYHPARQTGTLTCFYQHHQHDNPFYLPGLTDITAHVDFTLLAESFNQQNISINGFTTQAAFLLETDLLEHAKTMTHSPETAFKQAQIIKKLTLPTEMGETMKVFFAATDADLILPGFSLQDRRRDL